MRYHRKEKENRQKKKEKQSSMPLLTRVVTEIKVTEQHGLGPNAHGCEGVRAAGRKAPLTGVR
jgi:hypothetical protein